MNVLNRDEIKTFLPHREPMLLIDDVVMEGDTAIAHYHVRGDEFFLQGHRPYAALQRHQQRALPPAGAPGRHHRGACPHH